MAKKSPPTQAAGKTTAPAGKSGQQDGPKDAIASTANDVWKKNRFLIVGGVLIVLIGVGAYSGIGYMLESQSVALNEQLFKVLDGPLAKDPDYTPDLAELDRLLESAKGTAAEHYIVKRIGQFYVTRAAEDDASAISAAAGSATEDDAEPDSGLSRDEAAKRAMQVIESVLESAPENPEGDVEDLVVWAENSKKVLESRDIESWLPESPQYNLFHPEADPDADPEADADAKAQTPDESAAKEATPGGEAAAGTEEPRDEAAAEKEEKAAAENATPENAAAEKSEPVNDTAPESEAPEETAPEKEAPEKEASGSASQSGE